MATSTTYEVNTLFTMRDRASRGIDKISSSADRAAQSTNSLDRGLKLLAGAFIGRQAFGLAKRGLVDFNAQIEVMQIGLAGVMRMNLGASFQESMRASQDLFSQFQQDAKKSLGTTEDFVTMANQIAPALLKAGGNVKQLREVTKATVVASSAFNIRPDVAARDIRQALLGRASVKDELPTLLGLDTTKLNKASMGQRVEMLMKALTQPAIGEMAGAMEKSFSGSLSTLKDNLQLTFGEIGKPLVSEITKEFQKWNEWIEKNPDKIAAFAEDFKSALRSGMHAVRSIARALSENKELLMALAGLKALRGLGGVGGLFGFGQFDKQLQLSATGLASFAGKLLNAASGLSLLYVGAQAFADWVDRKQTDSIKSKAEFGYIRDAIGRAKKTGSLDAQDTTAFALAAKDIGAVKGGKFDREAARRALMKSGDILPEKTGIGNLWGGPSVSNAQSMMQSWFAGDRETGKKWMSKHERGLAMLDAMASAVAARQNLPSIAQTKPSELLEAKGAVAKTPVKVDVKIDVTTNDPDRFVMDVNSILEDAIRNPRSARHAPRGM